MSRPKTVVEVETSLRPVAPDPSGPPLRASLRYDPADPYAVHIVFHGGVADDSVTWSFARSVLTAGLDEPAGLGDVRVWPWSTPRGDYIALSVSSPDGSALFEVHRGVLVRFLDRSYAEVPYGHESDQLDVDAAVARLLGE